MVNTEHALGYGLPADALVLNWDSPAFTVTDHFHAEHYQVVAEYPDHNLLQSGMLIGENLIKNKIAMLTAAVGKGDVVLFGFAPQFRATAHGAYKLLFNCLL